MKRFLNQVFLFIFCTCLILSASGYITGTLINLKNEDIHKIPSGKSYVILGNSRPALAFNDSLIPSVYNFASVGESYFYTYLKAEQLIKNNKVLKVIFLEYNLEDIGHKRDAWTWGRDFMQNNYVKYSYAMHFYNYKYLLLKNPVDLLSVHMGQTFLRQLRNTVLFDIGRLRKTYGGYYFEENSTIKNSHNRISIDQRSHLNNISHFHTEQLLRLLKLFRDNHIKVYLIRCPLYYTNGKQYDYKLLRKFLGPENQDLEYLDFNNYPARRDEFKDPSHLNNKGAIKFSKFFNQLLESGLLKKQNKADFVRNEIRKAIYQATLKKEERRLEMVSAN